jgi:IPT/TIG domain
MSSRFDPTERRNEDLIGAIEGAAHHIATAITQGFAHMADAQATALADLSTAINNISDAITAEIQALQNALNAATSIQPNDSAAIEAQVAKLTTLTAALKAPLTPIPPVTPVTPVNPALPVVTSILPTSGPVAGGTVVTLTGTGLTGATGVTVGAAPATSLGVFSDTSLSFTAPSGLVGAAVVVVTGPGGVSGNATTFTYV